jgi:hypothetical protein
MPPDSEPDCTPAGKTLRKTRYPARPEGWQPMPARPHFIKGVPEAETVGDDAG